ncbi:MAG: hypothetical protein K8W52_11480 [Deltaproteobacteria bacterium]|nr:hypothetical protein [Deltaproteobacteria bacterium]
MDPTEPVTAFARVPAWLAQAGRACEVAPGGELAHCRYHDDGLGALVALRAVRTAAGSPWIALSIALGPAPSFRVRAALVANDALVIGALVEAEGVMLLRETLPLASLTFAQLDQALRALVHTAARIVVASRGQDPADAADGGLGYLFT